MKSLFEAEEKATAIDQLKTNLIAYFYPLTNEEVNRFKDVLCVNRNNLIRNEFVKWDYELIENLKDKIDWRSIWYMPNIKFDLNFFHKFDKKIELQSIPYAENIIVSDELIDYYGDRFEINKNNLLSNALSNLSFVRKYKDKIDWGRASRYINFGFTPRLITEFEKHIDWYTFSQNRHLPLTYSFLQQYNDKWNYDSLSANPASLALIYEFPTKINWNWDFVITNRGIKYDQEKFNFIFKYYGINHHLKKINPILKKQPITVFLNTLILGNHDVSFFLNDNYLKFISFDVLSSKYDLKLNLDFIIKYKDKLNFKESNLLWNIRDVINEDFIIENLEKFDLSSNKIYDLPISFDFLFKHINNINWNKLSSGRKLDWNWDFLLENWDKFNTYLLSTNKGVYEKLICQKMSKLEIINFLEMQLQERN